MEIAAERRGEPEHAQKIPRLTRATSAACVPSGVLTMNPLPLYASIELKIENGVELYPVELVKIPRLSWSKPVPHSHANHPRRIAIGQGLNQRRI